MINRPFAAGDYSTADTTTVSVAPCKNHNIDAVYYYATALGGSPALGTLSQPLLIRSAPSKAFGIRTFLVAITPFAHGSQITFRVFLPVLNRTKAFALTISFPPAGSRRSHTFGVLGSVTRVFIREDILNQHRNSFSGVTGRGVSSTAAPLILSGRAA